MGKNNEMGSLCISIITLILILVLTVLICYSNNSNNNSNNSNNPNKNKFSECTFLADGCQCTIKNRNGKQGKCEDGNCISGTPDWGCH